MSSYRSGTWTGLVAPGGLALLAPDFAAVAARSLWEAMVAERPLSAWLEAIAGGGLSALPDFALVQTEGAQVRVLVRGQVTVDSDGTEIRAEGMSTWREHVGPIPQHLRASGPEEGGQEWPLGSGVVSAAAVQFGSENVESHAAAATDDTSQDDTVGPEQTPEPVAPVAPVAGVLTPDEPEDAVESETSDGPGPEAEEASAAETPDEPEAEEAGGAETPDEPEDAVEPDEEAAGSEVAGDRGLIDSLPWNVPAMKAGQTPEGEKAEASSDDDGTVPDPDAQTGPDAETDTDADTEAVVVEAEGDDPSETPHSHPLPAGESDYISEATVFPARMVGGDAITGEHETDHGDDAAGEDTTEEVAAEEGAGQVDEDDGDHDGHTVLVAHLREALNSGGNGEVGEDTVLAGAASQPARVIPVLVLSTGQRVELDRPALLGRAPEATRFEGPVAPHLVAVPSPQQDISRTHVELKPEGDHVVVTDLRSTNGTVVTLPGAEARRLHPSEAIPVGAGAMIDLGDGVTAEVHIDQGGGEESRPAPDAGAGEPAPGQHPAAPAAPYGRPAPYGQPNPYGQPGTEAQPGHYGQPPAPGGPSQPGPYGPPPQGPGVPPPPGPYGSASGPGPVVNPYGPPQANRYGPYQGGAR